MTTREIAEQLKTSPKVILSNARKCLPNKIIRNGVPTFWTEEEVTVLIDYAKNHQTDRPNTPFTKAIKGLETSLSNDFEFYKILKQREELSKQIELYQSKRIAELEEQHKRDMQQNETLQIELDKSKEWFSTKRVLIETGTEYSWKPLRKYSKEHEYEVQKVFDKNYGEVNAYHIDVWNKVYGLEL